MSAFFSEAKITYYWKPQPEIEGKMKGGRRQNINADWMRTCKLLASETNLLHHTRKLRSENLMEENEDFTQTFQKGSPL